MISVKEAKEIVQQNVEALPSVTVPLIKAAGLTLSEDVVSDQNFPPFLQSAMDGYAFRFADWNGEPLLVKGEVQAGAAQKITVGKREAVRIFTGAPLPDGADTVIMQEKVTLQNDYATIGDNEIQRGNSVRVIGSEMIAGAVALEKNTSLSPGAIGFLAGLGKTEVSVVRKPSIGIIVTGKELQKPGSPLQYGQVYESNSYALSAALHQLNMEVVSCTCVDDDLSILTAAISEALRVNDLVLLTGGVSVGDYDFVAKALDNCEVEKLFHKIKQRPGKPLWFGKKEKCLVFGLPGNPSSVLTCFYEYVLTALQQMMGLVQPILTTIQRPLLNDYEKKEGLQHFLKGKLSGNEVLVLDAQESYRMRSFAMADCLIVLEENRGSYKKGEMVEVHLLPK